MADEKKKKQPNTPSVTAQEAAEQPISAEEQLMRRQSVPRPTAQSEAQRLYQMQQQRMTQGQGFYPNGALDGFRTLQHVIGREQVQAANQVLQRYKEGKKNLETRIIDNEQWYKLRHWECMRDEAQDIQPTSAWLFNCIANKHADAMDNFPAPNILPREEDDMAEAERLTSIIPVILDQCDFEGVYSDVQYYKLKAGTGVYGVFWDKTRLNGVGDVSIRKLDLINLFWEPGITDIQMSRNFFHLELADNDALIAAYPKLQGKLGSSTLDVKTYIYDDKVDTTNKSIVVDWYYKRSQNGRTVLHYCKYVNDEVLFATENDPELADRGWYDHGQYPFIFDPLFTVEGTPCGFGYIDIGKSAQEYIDRGNQAIMENMLLNAKPRFFIHEGGSVNEAEYADTKNTFIHVDGSLGQDSILPVQPNALNSIYVDILNNKVDELKETAGNRDISTGGTTSGVTAASAIAAMQEAGSKLSRDNNKASYRAFRKMCLMIIELIRQFYDLPRCFRIMGADGAARFVQYSNQGIVPQAQGGVEFGVDQGYRLPLFDIEITAQKQSPYSKMAQNELALQFYQAGFFNPALADQALACLDMMDFDRKHLVMQRIAANRAVYQQMRMLAGTAPGADPAPETAEGGAAEKVEETEALGGEGAKEASTTKKARQRVAESTDPT